MFFIQTAYAQQAAAPQGGGMGSMLMLIIMFVVMYFLMIRPQQKRVKEHRELVAALNKGDEVATSTGLMGRIVALDDFAVDLEVAKNTVIRIQRPFVAGILPKGSLKATLVSKAANEEASESAKVEKAEKAPEAPKSADDAQAEPNGSEQK